MDPHLGHDNIRKHCGRPFDTTQAMDEALIANYTRFVGKNDDVIIGGDFAWRNHAHYLAQLPGYKTLIWGNHDNIQDYALRGFERVVGSRRHPGILEFGIGEHQLSVCHYPLMSWNASFHGSWHVHGHCHGRLPERADVFRADLGVDVFQFRPVNFDVVRQKMLNRREAWKKRMAEMANRHAAEESSDAFTVNAAENQLLVDPWLKLYVAYGPPNNDYRTRYKMRKGTK